MKELAMQLKLIVVKLKRREPTIKANPNTAEVNGRFRARVRTYISPPNGKEGRSEYLADLLSNKSKAIFLSFTMKNVVPNALIELMGPVSIVVN